MRKEILLFGLALFSCGTTVYAQLTHVFTQTAHTNNGGSAIDVAVASDSMVFLANGSDGLRAYHYDGSSFINTAHINDGGNANGVAVAFDGTVFLANGGDGLRAYSYDGSSFTNTAHIDDGGENDFAIGVAVGSDGTVFLANGLDGLRAYSYNGNSFTNTAHIDGGIARSVAVASDGTVFLANGNDGLRAYSYNGNSFTNTAHIDDNGFAVDVAVASDGTVFLASGVFFDSGPDEYFKKGLRAYSYDGTSFTNTAYINGPGSPYGVAVASNGTVFLANGSPCIGCEHDTTGLSAYRYDGKSFINTAYIYNDGNASDVAVTSDGTVFLAGGEGGLFAYTYDIATGIDENLSLVPGNYALTQNYPNPFNPSTTVAFSLPQSSFVTLKVYNILGEKVATLLEAHKPAGRHVVNFDASTLTSGIYYYTLMAGDFKQSRKMVLMR